MITGNTFAAGSVKFTINPENIIETLDAVEKLDAKQMQGLADHFQLPAVPFEKRLLKPVIMGEVQSAWYKAFTGSVPEKCEVNQQARIERYKQQLEEVKNHTGEDKVVSRKSPSGSTSAAPRAANLYRLVESQKEVWGGFKGQKRLIVKVMLDAGAVGPDGKGVSVRFIADTVRDTEETKAPSDKNCAFHINAWGHESIIERINEDGTVAEVQKPKADEQPAPPPAEAKKTETPAAAKKSPAVPAKAPAKKKK